jgi:hypothetical protein
MQPLKVCLVGYPGSQFLVPASRYLTEKYLPGFDVRYINNTRPPEEWSAFVREYLETLTDEFVIFALDDYMLRQPLKQDIYEWALGAFTDGVACVKIHRSTPQEHEEYPVTTQYTIWRRTDLIDLLQQTTTPWDFEMRGSKLFRESGKKVVHGYISLEYYTASALSGRWSGVRLYGLTEDDAKTVQTLIDEHGTR